MRTSSIMTISCIAVLGITAPSSTWAEEQAEAPADVAPAAKEEPWDPTPDPGWALEAAVIGFSVAGVSLGLGIAADAWMGDEPEAGPLALEIGGLVAVGAANPIIFLGGRSARLSGDVEGCPGCRTAGWVFFPTHAAAAITTLALQFALDDPVPHGYVAAAMGLGSISNVLFAVDALMSHEEAVEEGAAAETSSWGEDDVAIAPLVAPVTGREGVNGGVLGLTVLH